MILVVFVNLTLVFLFNGYQQFVEVLFLLFFFGVPLLLQMDQCHFELPESVDQVLLSLLLLLFQELEFAFPQGFVPFIIGDYFVFFGVNGHVHLSESFYFLGEHFLFILNLFFKLPTLHHPIFIRFFEFLFKFCLFALEIRQFLIGNGLFFFELRYLFVKLGFIFLHRFLQFLVFRLQRLLLFLNPLHFELMIL